MFRSPTGIAFFYIGFHTIYKGKYFQNVKRFFLFFRIMKDAELRICDPLCVIIIIFILTAIWYVFLIHSCFCHFLIWLFVFLFLPQGKYFANFQFKMCFVKHKCQPGKVQIFNKSFEFSFYVLLIILIF